MVATPIFQATAFNFSISGMAAMQYRQNYLLFRNAVIFLLYKAVGQAKKENVLSINDPQYIEFLNIINQGGFAHKVGFDSCQSPAIYRLCPDVAKEAIEFCDSARFSMYIDCNLTAYPCSFAHDIERYAVGLNGCSIKEAWNSKQFSCFREQQSALCVGCVSNVCRTCALDIGLDMCGLNNAVLNRDLN